MLLIEKLDKDIKETMKARDKNTLEVLRFLKSALKDIVINQKKEITDDVFIEVVSKAIKQRKDSIESFRNAGREDLLEKEIYGVEILERYMPEQLTEEEIATELKLIISDNAIESKSEIGNIMKLAMPKFKGKADGKMINKIALELLS